MVMKVQKLLPMLTSTAARSGRHKVPRFIYHLTNKPAYESMLKDGFVKTSGDDALRGVYTTDIVNFFKRWRKNKAWRSASLQEMLVRQASKGKDDLVLLRIPTDKLNSNELIIRSQNRLFGATCSTSAQRREQIEKFMEEQSKLGVAESDICSLIFKKFFPEVLEHVEHGTPAKFSKLFKQRKEAIEYVYPHDIKISDAEKIGEVNVAELRKSAEYDPIRPMRSIFMALLKGAPEQKGASLLNC